MIKLCAFADEYGNSIKEQIEGLKDNGISLIELRSIDKKNVADFTDEEAKAYYEEFNKNGISVWSIGSPLGKVDIDCDFSEYENKIRRVFKTANIFNCKNIRIFSFFKAYDKKGNVFDYLNKMADIAKEYGVKLFHENEKEVYGDTFFRVKEIMDNTSGINFIFDPANYVQCGEDCKKILDEAADKFGYFHIKDVDRKSDCLVPAGKGDGEIPYLIDKIGNRDTVLTLEPHLMEFDAFKSIDNTEMKHLFEFKDGKTAFSFAVKTLKEILADKGYTEINGAFIKK